MDNLPSQQLSIARTSDTSSPLRSNCRVRLGGARLFSDSICNSDADICCNASSASFTTRLFSRDIIESAAEERSGISAWSGADPRDVSGCCEPGRSAARAGLAGARDGGGGIEGSCAGGDLDNNETGCDKRLSQLESAD